MSAFAPTWEYAYYPQLDREDFTVAEALLVRQQNLGEYRENPCYNSKEAYEEALGIQLTPVDNSGNNKVNFFRSFPRQSDVRNRVANSVGMGDTTSARYTESGIRVKCVIDSLSADLEEDKIPRDGMLMISAERSGNVNSLSHPDIIIYHRGDYSRRVTRIFVQDIGRMPQYEVLPDDWILVISKFAPNEVTSWVNLRPLFMKEWKVHEVKRERNLASELERIESEEARENLEGILDDLQIPEVLEGHAINQSEFNREIDRRLEDGDISSLSVANKIKALYLQINRPSTFINGAGNRVEYGEIPGYGRDYEWPMNGRARSRGWI